MYEKMIDKTSRCDLCGEKNPEGVIYKSIDMICLCPECHEKIEAMPQNIKESMEKMIMGNIL